MWKENLEPFTPKGWTPTHSFFAVMGGFFDSSTEKVVDGHTIASSKNSLDEYDLIIREGGMRRAVTISKEEILDRSKGDDLGKLVIVLQTLWFVTQYLGRWIDHLPKTQLEVMTLAYATLTVVVYCLWWHKPLNVQYPIAVSKVHPPPSTAHPPPSIASYPPSIAHYPPPFAHYPGVGIFQYTRLPKPKKVERFLAIMIVSVVSVIFGGIHCLAWNFPFPTSQERLAWRICATFVTADPVLLGVICNWGTDYEHIPTPFELMKDGVAGMMIIVFMTGYVISRGILFLITLLALRSSPPGVFQTVPWASFIPHIG
jgi:hypothetical protein